MAVDFAAMSVWATLSAPACALYASSSVNRTVLSEDASAPPVSLATVTGFAAAATLVVALSVSASEALATLVFASALIYFAAFDLRFLAAPVWPVVIFTVLGIGFAFFDGVAVALLHGAAALLGWGAFTVIAWVYRLVRGRDGMGAGDALVAAFLGAWLSFEGLTWSVALGAAFGVGFAVLRGFRRTEALPLVPALSLGAAVYLIVVRVWG